MTIHTIWGDFESEEELVKTGARMMGISYKKAWGIRQKALKEHEEERKRIEKAIQERKDLEQELNHLGVLKLQKCEVLEDSYIRLRYEVIR